MNYINNTNYDTRMFEPIILEAMKNGGIFDDDYSDIFVLSKTPAGSLYDYSLNMA